MRNSKTLARLRNNEPVRLCVLGHFIPSYVRHAAHFGFDCIWLDTEHRAMGDREIQSLLAFCHLYDIDCMVRAQTLEKTKLYRLLEDGASGLMIPHVSTEEKARMLVQAVKFPPLGDRGLDGAGLDSDFLVRGGEDYTDLANRETFLVVQIETPEAVRNVDAIAAVEGVDALFLGPGDLGLRLKHAGDQSMTIDDAQQKVAEAAEKHGKTWGRPAGSREMVEQYYQQGARLIAHGGEFITLMKMLENNAKELESIYN
jgi:2-keto-3-deoxy-L-rhamnonate aldolase RhmA